MPTTNTRYVDVDADVGGNGTTNALTGANCAYKSLAIWEAARQADLPTGDIIEECICDSTHANHTADSTSVLIDGWTTDATRYISIKVASASAHGGQWSNAKYRHVVSNSDGIGIKEGYVRINGLQVQIAAANAYYDAVYVSSSVTSGDIQISNLIIRGASDSTYVLCGFEIFGTPTIHFWNNILYGIGNNLLSSCVNVMGNCTLNVYSCTVKGESDTFGIRRENGAVTAKNCYASASAGYAYSGTITKTTCASADNTGSAGLQSIACNTTQFVNVSAGTEDFHLPLGSALIDVGTDTSGESAPLNFTTDIAGVTRSAWDIGAFEYAAAAAAYIFSEIPRGILRGVQRGMMRMIQ